ncbi:unnamed protein product [Periconia digitata]|uniref:Asl1-like glycosyl hydrolase catalytic domain-containing protein n=1 Tax=Periconia digitata TaxID=1303443 RepID=A0A9W4XNS9_9PLEO|nr:unnamed protein product [Periconia digitata]
MTYASLSTLLTRQAAPAAPTSPKRGLVHVPSSLHPTDDIIWKPAHGSHLTWYYNYKAAPSPSFADQKDLEFVPMLWGASDSSQGTPFLDAVTAQLESGANITHVLGFNEPDGPYIYGGSNISPITAALVWQREIEPLKKLGVKLGAPAVTGSPNGFEWLADWLEACGGGCNPDFIPVHWYGNFEGLASHVGQVTATFPGLKVWVTEWGCVDQGLAETQDMYADSVAMLDRWEAVERYSYFGAFRSDVSNIGPNSAMLTENGALTDIGSWYMGGSATGAIPHGSNASFITQSGWSRVLLTFVAGAIATGMLW